VAQANLSVAVAQRDASQANLDLVMQGASAAQIAAAESSLAQAEANLDSLLAGPTDAQITLSEIQVEQARINLARAEQNLADATLRAPFAGLVTTVAISPGELANGVVVELVDTNSLEVVLEVDEVDVSSYLPGQPVLITLEAWPDTEINGELRAIAPKAIVDRSELVTYEAYVTLGATDLPLLVGMTANADLTTAQRAGVLLVPNQAINADRSNNTYTVSLVQADGTTQEVEVAIGLRDRSYTEITSGLNEGDRLSINTIESDLSFGPGQGGGPLINGG
jgi:HlyD family secretion protein